MKNYKESTPEYKGSDRDGYKPNGHLVLREVPILIPRAEIQRQYTVELDGEKIGCLADDGNNITYIHSTNPPDEFDPKDVPHIFIAIGEAMPDHRQILHRIAYQAIGHAAKTSITGVTYKELAANAGADNRPPVRH